MDAMFCHVHGAHDVTPASQGFGLCMVAADHIAALGMYHFVHHFVSYGDMANLATDILSSACKKTSSELSLQASFEQGF